MGTKQSKFPIVAKSRAQKKPKFGKKPPWARGNRAITQNDILRYPHRKLPRQQNNEYIYKTKIKVMSLITVYGIEHKTIQEIIELVQGAPGSMYTKGDVISLLSRIKANEEESVLPAIHVEELANVVEQAFDNCDTSDLVDNEDVELSLNGYNQIEIDGINVDLEGLKQDVIEAVRGYFQKTA